MKNIKKIMICVLMLSFFSCSSSFKAERVDSKASDEKAMEITDQWVAKDTEIVIAAVIKQMQAHKGFKRYLRQNGNKTPKVFISEVKNLTSDAYFPISDLNDEFLNEISATGDFILIDADAREAILKELTYQNDGMVDPASVKLVGKQSGADLMIFGNVYMKARTRDGKTIKQYSVNIHMTDIEKGVEVLRTRKKVSKYSKQASSGW